MRGLRDSVAKAELGDTYAYSYVFVFFEQAPSPQPQTLTLTLTLTLTSTSTPTRYVRAVKTRGFPQPRHAFSMPKTELLAFEQARPALPSRSPQHRHRHWPQPRPQHQSQLRPQQQP